MQESYDAVIIGGAFSGAATALLLKRRCPSARVLILEKGSEPDRKVGESTTEVSGCFLTRILGLSQHLAHHQLAKQGLRMWFNNSPDQAFDDCVEIGARYQARLPTYQVDRATLDEHVLELAVAAGCDLVRPAKVTGIELNEGAKQSTNFTAEGVARTITSRWVIDASGRAAMLARKLGHLRQNTEHPINAVWARFTGVKDWDSYEWRERFPKYANAARTARSFATNHLMGHGWWCWIIPLRGGDVSAGLVYDSRIFSLPAGENLGERLRQHLISHPVGAEMFQNAQPTTGDVHAFSNMPYVSDQVCGDGWALVGDAAGFIDPLYSPGLDFCAFTTYFVADMAAHSLQGEAVGTQLAKYNREYAVMYRAWFETLYKDKYFYMGDAELMSAAFLLDVSMYFAGVVVPVYGDPEQEFLKFPFQEKTGAFFAALMKFYNRRLVALAKRRIETGTFGRRNSGWRELYDGFVPDARLRKPLLRGLRRWAQCEFFNLRLFFEPRIASAVAGRPPANAAVSRA